MLAEIADRVGLAEALAVGASEARAGVGRLATVLADAMEAAIGALYLDGGLEPARRFVRTGVGGAMGAQAEPPKDAKTDAAGMAAGARPAAAGLRGRRRAPGRRMRRSS